MARRLSGRHVVCGKLDNRVAGITREQSVFELAIAKDALRHAPRELIK